MLIELTESQGPLLPLQSTWIRTENVICINEVDLLEWKAKSAVILRVNRGVQTLRFAETADHIASKIMEAENAPRL